jgi:hypothetical protein
MSVVFILISVFVWFVGSFVSDSICTPIRHDWKLADDGGNCKVSFEVRPHPDPPPEEKEQPAGGISCSNINPAKPDLGSANPVAHFCKTQGTFLLLLGEQAGMREVVN